MFVDKILIVDDEKNHRLMLRLHLLEANYEVEEAENGLEALNLIKQAPYKAILLDLRMDVMDGLTLLELIRKQNLRIPVIIISALATIKNAVKTTKLGAIDFLTKPVNIDYLLNILKNLEPVSAEDNILAETDFFFDGVFHPDSSIKKVIDQVKLVADTDAKVLILGESGVGKELVARAIHKNSRRASSSFVPVNCGAINENLIESEFFGHVKGSFTGAYYDKVGKFEQSIGGTLFLDEISELPLQSQTTLLRVIQEKQIERVGSTKKIDVDVRIIAATNKDLKNLVKEGKFREDLFYRINVFPIYIPPLRERKKDIETLIDFFIKKYASKYEKIVKMASKEFMNRLLNYSFPGNVRELENIIERTVIMTRQDILDVDLLPSFEEKEEISKTLNIYENEKYLITDALKQSGGNKTVAAKLLGISRKSLHNKIKEYNITS
jgi:two-component system response regulator HydG